MNLEGPAKRPTDFLLILFFLIAVVSTLLAVGILFVFLLTTSVDLPWTDYIPGVERLPSDRQFLISMAVLLLTTLISLFLSRWRLQRNQSYQFSNGCPSCHQHDLIRTHRQQYQRIIAQMLKISLRNYACRSCRWQGVLVYPKSQKSLQMPLPSLADQEDAAVHGKWRAASAEIAAADTEETTSLKPHEVTEEVEEEISPISDDGVAADGNHPIELQEETGETGPADPDQQELTMPSIEDHLSPSEEGAVSIVDPNYAYTVADAPVGDHVDANEAASAAETEESSLGAAGEEDTGGEGVEFEVKKARSLADPPLDRGPFEQGQVPVVKAVVVAPFGLSLRTAPESKAEIILAMAPDTVVEVLNYQETESPVSWRQVRYEGQVGWAAAAFLRYLQA